MSRFVLLLLLFLGSCTGETELPPVFHDEIADAPLLTCAEHDGLHMPGTASELSTSGDTAVLALFGDARTIVLFDDSLRVLRRLELAQAGPNAVHDPVSILADGDSLIIADAEGQQILVSDWTGERRRRLATDFAPLQLARAGDRIAIAPAVIGRFPGTLLFYLHNGAVRSATVGVVEFADLTTKALANRVKLLPGRDGLILLHQFFIPRAIHVSDRVQRSLRVPLASGLKAAIGYVPPLPLNDEALQPALVVANDAARAGNNEFLLLVRTGRNLGDRFEKAIMRTDSVLKFISAHRLPASPGLMTYLPRTRTSVLVDEEGRWFTCPLP